MQSFFIFCARYVYVYMETSFLHWIEHAGFRLELAGKNVYIDPFKLSKDYPKADIIFITHPHFDHLHVESIERIAKQDTLIIAPLDAEEKLRGRRLRIVKPGDSGSIEDIDYRVVHAYNSRKDRLGFHPKESGWLGYIVSAGGKSVYHAGDTDTLKDMKGVKVDVALLPIGGTYTMDAKEAAGEAAGMSAGLFVPMHYKAVLGKAFAAAAEAEFCKGVKSCKVMEQEQEPIYSF